MLTRRHLLDHRLVGPWPLAGIALGIEAGQVVHDDAQVGNASASSTLACIRFMLGLAVSSARSAWPAASVGDLRGIEGDLAAVEV